MVQVNDSTRFHEVLLPDFRVQGWRSVDDVIRKLRRLSARCASERLRREPTDDGVHQCTFECLRDEIDNAADLFIEIVCCEPGLWHRDGVTAPELVKEWAAAVATARSAWLVATIPLLDRVRRALRTPREDSLDSLTSHPFGTFALVIRGVSEVVEAETGRRLSAFPGGDVDGLEEWFAQTRESLEWHFSEGRWRDKMTAVDVQHIPSEQFNFAE